MVSNDWTPVDLLNMHDLQMIIIFEYCEISENTASKLKFADSL